MFTIEDVMDTYVLWHNPRCSKSRAALDLLREHGIEPTIRDYLGQPPDAAEISDLLRRLDLPARVLLRAGEPEYASLGLADPARTDNDLIAAVAAHPHLIERPVLVHGARAVIGRPPERLLALFA